MRPPYAMMALAGAALAAPIALAQIPAPVPQGTAPAANMTGPPPRAVATVPPLSPVNPAANPPAPTPSDRPVFDSAAPLPAPTMPDQVPGSSMTLPTDPIEPFLLTRDNGPFMVMAKTFRGPDAERWAVALCIELRNEYHLPAYILRAHDFANRSNIRGIPPTADQQARKPYLTEPERSRAHDEAVVLVGDEKTLKGTESLLHVVKKIKPKCLKERPSVYFWRDGLSKAWRTTNPFVPAQDLFPQKSDPLVAKLNTGPHSVLQCPGHYTLQIAEFGGRATFLSNDKNAKNPLDSSDSPLERAFDDAENLAEFLAKDPEVRQTGCLPYVYHDRTSRRVMVGAFNAPNEPAALKLRESMLKLAIPLAKKRKDGTVIVPAPYLTDVEGLKTAAQ